MGYVATQYCIHIIQTRMGYVATQYCIHISPSSTSALLCVHTLFETCWSPN